MFEEREERKEGKRYKEKQIEREVSGKKSLKDRE